jgi:KDO2-lipid IV(A) lauroyltransferase
LVAGPGASGVAGAPQSVPVIAFLLYKLGGAVCRFLPVGFSYWVARLLADSNFLINRRSRRAVIANLMRVLADSPEPVQGRPPRWNPRAHRELDRIARRVFHNFALNIVDFLRFPLLDLESLPRVIAIEGWQHLMEAHARGRGVILLSAHVGNWELGGAVFGLNGIRLKVVALDHGAGRVTRFFAERRRAKGIESLPLTGSTYAMLEWLRQGGAVALIADRDFAHQGMPVPFFGQTAMMPRAHASLALKTGASVLPCFVVRGANNRFRMLIHPPVSDQGLPEEDRVGAFVERCLPVFEEVIRRYPDQWFVFVPLWGSVPETAAKAARTGTATGAPA